MADVWRSGDHGDNVAQVANGLNISAVMPAKERTAKRFWRAIATVVINQERH
jgi:predicted HAD superfamily phosphohydrolase YqeG